MAIADLAIVGLGAMGSAALLAAARRGLDVVGLDRFSPPHSLGSTHGETRIVRAGIGEGLAYSRLALRSFELWGQLAAETGEDYVRRCGCLVMGADHLGHTRPDFLRTSIEAAQTYGVPHEVLDAAELRRRFPAFEAYAGGDAYFEPGAGLAFPERVLSAQIERAQRLGARTLLDTEVLGVRQHGAELQIATAGETITARRAIFTAGAWMPRFLPPTWASSLTVLRQTLHWFDVARDRLAHDPAHMPVFIWDRIYGFPMVDGLDGGIKIATEDMTSRVDPDRVSREITPEDITLIEAHARRQFPQLGQHMRAVACLYTATPDSDFRVDAHPQMDRVTLVSACSGHGFKHSAALGEALVADPGSLGIWAWR